MLSRAVPYEGNEPYIFLSYCHQDAACVYPLLEQMVRDGYRIWYDEGNHPGDDWPENIARHLEQAAVVIAMISEASSRSHNCKNELSFAIGDLGKKTMAVVLEEFTMPLGMRMQLSSTHYIKKSEYPSEHMLLRKLYEGEGLTGCRSAAGSLPMREIPEQAAPVTEKTPIQEPVVSKPVVMETVVSRPVVVETVIQEPEVSVPVAETPDQTAQEKPVKVKTKVQVTKKKVKVKVKPQPEPEKVEANREPEVLPEQAQPEESQPEPVAEEKRQDTEGVVSVDHQIGGGVRTNDQEDTPPRSVDDDDDGVTVYDDSHDRRGDDSGMTEVSDDQLDMVLIRLSTGKAYVLQSVMNSIGRSGQQCDVVLSGNPAISSCHAEIIQYNGQCYLRDAGSTNGTFLNGAKLEKNEKALLASGAQFHLDKEAFLFFSGTEAKALIKQGKLLYLRNINTGAVRVLAEDELWLDRGHKWPDGTLSDIKISRSFHHAVLRRNGELFMLEDMDSTNGTFINEENLKGQPPAQVKEMDRIRLGDTVLEVGAVTI